MQKELDDLLFDDENNIWEFLYQKLVVESKYANISDELWNDYITTNKRNWTAKEMNDYYEKNMKKVLRHAFIPDYQILALFKFLQYPFTEDTEAAFLKRSAPKVRTRGGRLVDFRMKGSSCAEKSAPPKCKKTSESLVEKLVEERPAATHSQVLVKPIKETIEITPAEQPKTAPILYSHFEVTPERKEKMWEYVEKDLGNVRNNEFVLTSFWISFARTQNIPPNACIRAGHHFAIYFTKEILPDVWKRSIDLKLKMKLLSDLKVEITETVRKMFLTVFNVRVELDERRCIDSWGFGQREETEEEEEEAEIDSPSTSSLRENGNEEIDNLKNRELNGRNAFSAIDHVEMANFLYNEIFDNGMQGPHVIQPKGVAIWKKFKKLWNNQRSAVNLASHYRRGFQSILYTVHIPHSKILKLYKYLKIEVNKPVQEIMAINFKAKIKFVENRVVSWEFIGKQKENESSHSSRKRSHSTSTDSESDSLIGRRRLAKYVGKPNQVPISQGHGKTKYKDLWSNEPNSERSQSSDRDVGEVENTEEIQEHQLQQHAQEHREPLEERPEFHELPEIKQDGQEVVEEEEEEQPQPHPVEVEVFNVENIRELGEPRIGYDHLLERTRQILEDGLRIPPRLRQQFLRDVRRTYEVCRKDTTTEEQFFNLLELKKPMFQDQVRFFLL